MNNFKIKLENNYDAFNYHKIYLPIKINDNLLNTIIKFKFKLFCNCIIFLFLLEKVSSNIDH